MVHYYNNILELFINPFWMAILQLWEAFKHLLEVVYWSNPGSDGKRSGHESKNYHRLDNLRKMCVKFYRDHPIQLGGDGRVVKKGGISLSNKLRTQMGIIGKISWNHCCLSWCTKTINVCLVDLRLFLSYYEKKLLFAIIKNNKLCYKIIPVSCINTNKVIFYIYL